MSKAEFIDLFCGCGGFTLGMQRAGFNCRAALDFYPEAIKVFRTNLPSVPHVLEQDLTRFRPVDLAAILGQASIDVIVGGPPCQGFSTVRRVDGANNGVRLIEDPRRHLYREFLRYVEFFQPKVFVMENVLGIRSASGGEYFSRVQKEARSLGYRVHAQIEDCVELGVPQKRRRQLFIGTRLGLPAYFSSELNRVPRACEHPTLWDAIGDLPQVDPGEEVESMDYDMDRRRAHVERFDPRYLYSVLEVERSAKLTAHCARPHSERDLKDFKLLKEGESSAHAMRRGVEFGFPYDKGTFKDRYTKQSRWHPCSTIVAHLSKDGLMFIHPTQNRSLTPREAARIQSFPDWFEFPVSRTHQFKLIGNAVPPLVSEAVGNEMMAFLEASARNTMQHNWDCTELPRSEHEAINWLMPMLDLSLRALRKVPDLTFKRAWFSIAYLHEGLHPLSAQEHGNRIAHDAPNHALMRIVEPRLIKPYYEQSGWPVALAPVAKEAWRRYESGSIKDDEFYCSRAQMAGICHRSPKLVEEVREGRAIVAM